MLRATATPPEWNDFQSDYFKWDKLISTYKFWGLKIQSLISYF